MSKTDYSKINTLIKARQMVDIATQKANQKGIYTDEQYIDRLRKQNEQLLINTAYNSAKSATKAREYSEWMSPVDRIQDGIKDSFAGTFGNATSALLKADPKISGKQYLDETERLAVNKLDKQKQFNDPNNLKSLKAEFKKEFDNMMKHDPEKSVAASYKSADEYAEAMIKEASDRLMLTKEEQQVLKQQAKYKPLGFLDGLGEGMQGVLDPYDGGLTKYLGVGALNQASGWLEKLGEADIFRDVKGRTVEDQYNQSKVFDEVSKELSDGERVAKLISNTDSPLWSKNMWDPEVWNTADIKKVGKADYVNDAYQYYEDKDRRELFNPENLTGDSVKDFVNNAANMVELYKRNPTLFASDTAGQLKYVLPGVGTAALVADWSNATDEMVQAQRAKTGNYMLDDVQQAEVSKNSAGLLITQKLGQQLTKGAIKGTGIGTAVSSGTKKATGALSNAISKIPGNSTIAGRAVTGASGRLGRTGLAIGTEAIGEGLQETMEGLFQAYGSGNTPNAAELGQQFGAGFAIGGGLSTAGQSQSLIKDAVTGSTDIYDQVKNKEAYLSDEDLQDITNKNYNPSRVINRISSAASSSKATPESIQEAVSKMDTVVDSLRTQTSNMRAAKQKIDRSRELMNELRDTTISPEDRQNKTEELQDLMAEIQEGPSEEDVNTLLPKLEANLEKAEAEYLKGFGQLDNIRARKGFDPIQKTAVDTTQTSEGVRVDSEGNPIRQSTTFTVDPLNPDKGIDNITKSLSVENTDMEIDDAITTSKASITSYEEDLAKVTEIENEISGLESGMDNLNKQIKTRDTAIKQAKSLEQRSQLEQVQSQARLELKALKEQRDELVSQRKEDTETLKQKEEKLERAKAKITGLETRAAKLKEQRAEKIAKLAKRKTQLEGRTDARSVKEYERVSDELADLQEGKLNDKQRQVRQANRKLQKAQKRKEVFDKVNNRLTQLKESEATIKSQIQEEKAGRNNQTSLDILQSELKDTQAKIKEFEKRVKRVDSNKINKEITDAEQEIDKLVNPKKTKTNKTKTKTDEALNELKSDRDTLTSMIDEAKEKLDKVEEGSKTHKTLTNFIKAREKELKEVNSKIKNMEGVTSTVTVQDKQGKKKKVKVKNDDSLTRRLRNLFDTGISNESKPVEIFGHKLPKVKLDRLLKIARQLDEMRVVENALKKAGEVTNDILNGNSEKGWLGLRDYETALGLAVENNDKETFNRYIGKLQILRDSHRSKAKALREALKAQQGKGPQIVYRIKGSRTEWAYRSASKLEQTGLTAEVRKTGSILVKANTAKLSGIVTKEAEIIDDKFKKLKELQSLIEDDTNQTSPIEEEVQVEEEIEEEPEDNQEQTQETEEDKDTGKSTKFKTNSLPPKADKYTAKKKGEPADIISTFDGTKEKLKLIMILWEQYFQRSNKGSSAAKKGFYNIRQEMQALGTIANKSIAFGRDGQYGTENKFKGMQYDKDKLEEQYAEWEQLYKEGKVPYADWEAVFAEEFLGHNNSLTLYNEEYTSDDVVAILRNGFDDNKETYDARNKEIKAAIKAGATIVMPSVMPNEKLKALKEYVLKQGYETKKEKVSIGTKNVTVEVLAKKEDIQDTNTAEDTQENTEDKEAVLKTKDTTSTKEAEITVSDQYDTKTITEEQWKPVGTEEVATKEVKEESGKLATNNNQVRQRNTRLNSQKNFFSKFLGSKNYEALEGMLGFKITKENKQQLDAFIRLHNRITVRANKALKDPDFNNQTKDSPLYKALVSRDADGNPVLDENVITAIAVSAFQYFQSNGRNSYLDLDQIKNVHGIDDYTNLSKPAQHNLSKWGSHRGFIFQELGKGAIRALGLQVGPEAEYRSISRMEAELGALAYTILNQKEETPFFVEHKINGKAPTHKDRLIAVVSGLSKSKAVDYLGNLYESTSAGPMGSFIDGTVMYDINQAKNKAEIIAALKKADSQYLKTTVHLVRPNIERVWDKKEKKSTTYFHPDILDIVMSSKKEKGAEDLLDNLFSETHERAAPLEEMPETFDQETVIKGTTKIPANYKEALLKVSQQEWGVQSDKADMMLALYDSNPEQFYDLMGILSDEDINRMHPSDRETALTERNIQLDLLEKQVAWLKGRKSKDGYKGYFQKPVVWVNQRVGYASTLWNAQTNMFARMLSNLKSWETEFSLNDPIVPQKGSELSLHGRFFLMLAENMEGASAHMDFTGTKYRDAARTVDKVKPQDFLPRFISYLENSEVIADAVAAIYDLQEFGEITKDQQAALKTAIKELDQGELSLGALMEYAAYLKAKEAGASTYTTTMGSQSDGITNGPIITQFLLGVAKSTVKLMGGIIGKQDFGQGVVDFFETKAMGNLDLYETTGKSMAETLEDYIPKDSIMSDTLAVIKLIDDDFGSRSWAKKLLTPFNYGASFFRIRAAIAENVVAKFEEEYKAIYADNTSEADRRKALKAFNDKLESITQGYANTFMHTQVTANNADIEIHKLVAIHNGQRNPEKQINPRLPESQLRDELKTAYNQHNFNDLDALNNISRMLRGNNGEPTITEVKYENIEDIFHEDIADMVYKLANITYSTAAVRSIAKTEKVYIEKRNMLTDIAGEAFDNFNQLRNLYIQEFAKDPNNITKAEMDKIERELNKSKAAVASAMSNLNLDADGRRISAIASGIDLMKVGFRSVSGLNIPFNTINRKRNEATSVDYSYGYSYKDIEDPGVRSLALMIQSLDAATSIQAISTIPGMNFHDANVFGLKDAGMGIRAQNEKFYDTIRSYEPSKELIQGMIRPLYRMRDLIQDDSLSDKFRKDLVQILKAKQQTQEVTIKQITTAYNTEIAKLEETKNDAVIHQYGGHGGQYTIPPEVTKAIDKRIKELKSERDHTIKTYKEFINNFEGMDKKIVGYTNEDLIAEINNLDPKFKQNFLKQVLENPASNASTAIELLKNTIKKGQSPVFDYLMQVLGDFNDTDLSKIKIVRRKSSHQKDFWTGDVRYNSFTKAIEIKHDVNDWSMNDFIKELTVAAFQQNFKVFKLDPSRYPEQNKIISNIQLLLDSHKEVINRKVAEMTKADGQLHAEITQLMKTLNNSSNTIEEVMYLSIRSDVVKDFLSDIQIKNNENAYVHKSLLERIKEAFNSILKLTNLTSIPNTSLGDFIFRGTTGLIDSVRLIRHGKDAKTIKQLVNESLTSQNTNWVSLEDADIYTNIDNRLMLEMIKLKRENGNKAIPLRDFVTRLKQALLSYDNEGIEGYREVLIPVLDMLYNNTSKTTLTILESPEDLKSIKANATGVERRALTGRVAVAFSHADGSTNIVFNSFESSSNPILSASILVHELVHASNSSYMYYNNGDPKVKVFLSKMNQLRKEVVTRVNDAIAMGDLDDHTRARITYGLTGDGAYLFNNSTGLFEVNPESNPEAVVDEFLAEVLSNKGFQDVLRSMRVDSELKRTTKTKEPTLAVFYDEVMQALGVQNSSGKYQLGIDNALRNFSVLLAELNHMMLNGKKANKAKQLNNLEPLSETFVGYNVGAHKFLTADQDAKLLAYNFTQYLKGVIEPNVFEYAESIKNQAKETVPTNEYEVAVVDMANQIVEDGIASEMAVNNAQMGGAASGQERHPPKLIADFLGKKVGKEHTYLNRVITEIVNPMMDKLPASLVEGYDYTKVWHEAIVAGRDVYSSKAIDAGFELDEQQAYVLEVLEASLLSSLDSVSNTTAFNELQKTYKLAKEAIKPEDFHNGRWEEATAEEQDIAYAKYNLVFRPGVRGSIDGKSDYLVNFAALAIVSPEMQRVLAISKNEAINKPEDASWFEKIVHLFQKVVDFWTDQTINIRSTDTLARRTQGLVEALSDIYYKNLDNVLENERNMFSKLENNLEKLSENLAQKIKNAGITVLSVPGLQNNSKTARIGLKVLQGKTKDFDKYVNEVLDYARPNKPIGNVRETFNEIAGTLESEEHDDIVNALLATKAIEQERGALIEDIAEALIDYMSDENKELSNEENKGVSNIFLRTDLSSLMDDMSFNDIVGLIEDGNKLRQQINTLETQLRNNVNGIEYITRAKALGEYLVTRQTSNMLLAKNAYAIAERVGLGRNAEYSDAELKAIDQLVTMYALRNTSRTDKDNALAVLEREASNDKEVNGIEFMMLSHKRLNKEAQELFEDNPFSIQKGHTPSLLNPNKGFAVVEESMVAQYEQLGYKRATTLSTASLDRYSPNKVLMTISNTGKQRYVSGAMSIEETNKSGTVVLRRGEIGFQRAVRTALNSFNSPADIDPVTGRPLPQLIPSYDTNGEIISFSYEMSNIGLDTYLDRTNNPITLISQYKGSNLSKKHFPNQNKRIVEGLIDKYAEADEKDKRKFVKVSPDSNDKKVRDYWNSLPKETQMYIEHLNGDSFLYVRNDELNTLMGFRKFNPSDAWNKDEIDRNILEVLYTSLFELPFGDKAKLRHDQGFTFMLEIIKKLKDFIAIRNVKVLYENIRSNMAFLMLNKTDPINAYKDIKDALTYSLKYQKESMELNKLKHEMAIGLSSEAKTARYVELQDSIARNPLKEFIDAGMMPMIVNDMSFKKGEMDYNTSLDTLVDNTFGRLPNPIQRGTEYLLASPGTPLYSLLANATQQSDFVFKYAIYKQEIRKGKDKKQAMKLARMVYINYDIPTNRGLQFLNDVGLWMFTKFALRIQRALLHYAKEKPGKLATEHFITSSVMNDPSIVSLNLVNYVFGGRTPWRVPTDNVLNMYGNALPVQALYAIFK